MFTSGRSNNDKPDKIWRADIFKDIASNDLLTEYLI